MRINVKGGKSSVVLTKREVALFDEAALFMSQLGTMLADKNAVEAAASIVSLRKRIDDKGTYTPEAAK